MAVSIHKQSISETLKALRKYHGYTLRDVQDVTGISIGHLSDFERGEADITLGRLETLVTFYGYELSLVAHESSVEDTVFQQGYRQGITDAIKQLEALKG